MAFDEDKTMIEAQRKIADRTPDETMMTLSFDRSVALFRRLMAQLSAEDGAAAADRGTSVSG